MNLLPECAELEAYRLERDWTWEQLAAAMARLDIEMSPRTLHYLVKRMPDEAGVRDRTLYKIRKFLKHARAAELRRKTRRRKPASAAASA